MSDYAALAEKARNGGGIPVKGDVETEAETMQWRHWFERDDFVAKLTKLFRKKGLLAKKSREARECVEKYYNWDLTAKKWEYILDSVDPKDRTRTWELKREVSKLPSDNLHEREDLSNEQFIDACYAEILQKEPDDEGRTNWLQNLGNGQPRKDVEKYFRRIINKRNRAAQLLGCGEDGQPCAPMHPIERIAKSMDKDDEFRILYCMPETAGDVLISTAIINKLSDEYPEASIYVATQEKYFDILEGNPDIKGVVPFDQNLENYRTSEPFGPSPGFVDFCFCPYIITQRVPHWIHGGRGESLGVSYAHMCNLSMTNEDIMSRMSLQTTEPEDELAKRLLNEKFVTFHAQTTQDPKDYDDWDSVFDRLQNITVVQVGGPNEPLLDYPNLIDLRGKTTPQELAWVIDHAELHIGQDSFPAHVANAMGTESIIVYGGTYAKQGGLQNSVAIEPEYRNGCHTSCHLINCIVKQQGGEKCINNISPEIIVDAIRDNLGFKYIAPEKVMQISAYCIIKDGNKYKFPYKECIKAALKIADEFIMVDGGSTDGTWEDLQELAAQLHRPSGGPTGHQPLKIFQHEWDMSDAMVMGAEKTYARQQCTGEYLIQLDADEIIVEKQPGQIRQLIKRNRNVLVFDFPVVNFYGDDKTVRIDDSIWKWRVTKNDPDIIHGVHAAARDFDCETMKITFDKKVSDGCEYINRNTLEIIPHKSVMPPAAHQLHEHVRQARSNGEEITEQVFRSYKQMITEMVSHMPVVFHYSWLDLDNKVNRGTFWETTVHGKKEETHNTSKDIQDRISNDSEITIEVDINHPLRGV
jgi:ADP-heptose:LPS heptosyltransferase